MNKKQELKYLSNKLLGSKLVAYNESNFDIVVSLINNNIQKIRGYKNFSVSEYKADKNTVFNIKHKIKSTYQIDIQDMDVINKIYKKHIDIQSI